MVPRSERPLGRGWKPFDALRGLEAAQEGQGDDGEHNLDAVTRLLRLGKVAFDFQLPAKLMEMLQNLEKINPNFHVV